MTTDLPADLLEVLSGIGSLAVITGAGISAESGIRTYRGSGGLYDDPRTGDRTVEALSGSTLASDPDRTWRTLAELASQALDAKPNAAHRALAELERRKRRFVLLTQNVDGLHRAAGSRNIIDIHGDLRTTACSGCDRAGTLSLEELSALAATPRCVACGARLRPGVVLFEELLPEEKLARIGSELIEDAPDLVIAIGTTAMFPYIAAPVLVAARAGRPTLEINPEPTPLSSSVRWSLRGRAGDLVPRIAAAIYGRSLP